MTSILLLMEHLKTERENKDSREIQFRFLLNQHESPVNGCSTICCDCPIRASEVSIVMSCSVENYNYLLHDASLGKYGVIRPVCDCVVPGRIIGVGIYIVVVVGLLGIVVVAVVRRCRIIRIVIIVIVVALLLLRFYND